MRIRKLITQKKISVPNSSYCNNRSSSSSIRSSCAAAAATSTVSTSTTSSKEKEEERVNNLQKQHVGACELNMSVWDVTPDDELLYYRKDEEISKVIKNEDKEQKDYHDEDKITDESVDTEEYQISTEEDDSESEEDDEETEEEEESKEEQYATENKGKLGLKSVTKNDDDKKRKREFEENHIESEEDIEETEIDNEGKIGLKSEKKKNKRKLENDSDYNIDDYEEEKKNKEVYCCKTNGKGWHCRSKAQIGNPLCENHMIQMQRYSDYHYHQRKLANKRIGRPPKESRTNTNDTTTNRVKRNKRKRGRLSNKGKLSGKKSSEFYYYSGFGPSWGKSKRGRPSNEVKKQPEDSEVKLDEERQVIIDEALITHGISPVKVKEENVNVNDNGCIMFVDDEFDDDYNTDEDCNGVNGKTKNRKPIKARSLNSLF
ncbi:hypothetical protein MKW98_004221 [Papaver atlanticum]|uniref:WRC domain-containing protein n=1 Tax=Papaver atlanticum TaxID=357466 RepID=A0AAD4T8P4_9MAGN|nr:hypothetical protein MKW98_004221 [Papaver atlanticum]